VYYLGPDGKVYDDGRGDGERSYGVGPTGQPYELAPAAEAELLWRYREDHSRDAGLSPDKLAQLQALKSRIPLGDVIARITGAMGIQPCAPCKQRQAALNRAGDWGAEQASRAVRFFRNA